MRGLFVLILKMFHSFPWFFILSEKCRLKTREIEIVKYKPIRSQKNIKTWACFAFARHFLLNKRTRGIETFSLFSFQEFEASNQHKVGKPFHLSSADLFKFQRALILGLFVKTQTVFVFVRLSKETDPAQKYYYTQFDGKRTCTKKKRVAEKKNFVNS